MFLYLKLFCINFSVIFNINYKIQHIFSFSNFLIKNFKIPKLKTSQSYFKIFLIINFFINFDVKCKNHQFFFIFNSHFNIKSKNQSYSSFIWILSDCSTLKIYPCWHFNIKWKKSVLIIFIANFWSQALNQKTFTFLLTPTF